MINAKNSGCSAWKKRCVITLVVAFGLVFSCTGLIAYQLYPNPGHRAGCLIAGLFNIEGGLDYSYPTSSSSGLRDSIPRWTPDGSHIVFSTWSRTDRSSRIGYEHHVHVVATDGSSLVTLSMGYPSGHSPLLSPDGSRVAFSSYKVVGEHRQYLEITTSSIDGSDQKTLTHEVGVDVPSAWLNDGTRILFTRNAPDYCGAHDPSDVGLYTMRADGSDLLQISPAKGAGISEEVTLAERLWWSPDERHVALLIEETVRENDPSTARTHYLRRSLVAVDTHDSNVTRLVTGDKMEVGGYVMAGSPFSPFEGPIVWSPDGARITFLRGGQKGSDRTKLYSINRDGSDLQEVVGPDADYARLGGRKLSWSPHYDGPQIMFLPQDPLYLVHVDGSDYRFANGLPPRFGASGIVMSWSPDGSRIAVAVPSPSDPADVVALYTVAPDGSDMRILARRKTSIYDAELEAVRFEQRRSALHDARGPGSD